MTLLIDPLKKVFSSLTKGMERSFQNPDDLEIRDGCIQRFEYTYELVIRFLKRFIQTESSMVENPDGLNFRDLLRIGAEIGLLRNVEDWFKFREALNKTSHVYDEKKAIEVYNVIPDFIEQTQIFISELEKKLSKNDRS